MLKLRLVGSIVILATYLIGFTWNVIYHSTSATAGLKNDNLQRYEPCSIPDPDCVDFISNVSSTRLGRRLLNDVNVTTVGSLYPEDVFSESQLKNGAVILHVIGVIYMFVALAIVCEEFFVPSLEVITEKLDLSDDVAGATFMAAGGSAPELFTNVVGVFIAQNDVGVGTIVGSAVFNILFVIGCCSIFSLTLLQLTWWPLFRDVTFYSISLLLLIVFFWNGKIALYEALILFIFYLMYGVFMKFNATIEKCVKKKLGIAPDLDYQAISSVAMKNRHSVVHSLLHHQDRGSASHVSSKSFALSSNESTISSVQSSVTESTEVRGSNSKTSVETSTDGSESTIRSRYNEAHDESENATTRKEGSDRPHVKLSVAESSVDLEILKTPRNSSNHDGKQEGRDDEGESNPLDMSWPSSTKERISYVLCFPLVFSLWLTLPDVRREGKAKYFPITFLGSIVWIGIFSYFMVWWATVTGDTVGIPADVMGLLFLSMGTSVPDLLTSVAVAKKGLGDMAVSSSVGSNLFDITVGLPVPWLMYSAVHEGADYAVNSKGLLCMVFLLFVMLLAVVISIACFKWAMHKSLGVVMIVLYLVFLTFALLLNYEEIKCPLDDIGSHT